MGLWLHKLRKTMADSTQREAVGWNYSYNQLALKDWPLPQLEYRRLRLAHLDFCSQLESPCLRKHWNWGSILILLILVAQFPNCRNNHLNSVCIHSFQHLQNFDQVKWNYHYYSNCSSLNRCRILEYRTNYSSGGYTSQRFCSLMRQAWHFATSHHYFKRLNLSKIDSLSRKMY